MGFVRRVTTIDYPGIHCWVGYGFAIACLVSWTSVASATCGDYLHHGRGQAVEWTNHNSSTESGEQPVRTEYPVGQQSPVEPRCSGPSCHRFPLPLSNTPQPNLHRFTAKEICFRRDGIEIVDARSSLIVTRSELPAASPVPDRLDRPPKSL